MLGAQGLWTGRDLYRATSAVTRDLGFSGLIRRTAPISRLLWHTWRCGESILTWILTGYSLIRSRRLIAATAFLDNAQKCRSEFEIHFSVCCQEKQQQLLIYASGSENLGAYLRKFVDTNVDVSPDVVCTFTCGMELTHSTKTSEISLISRVLHECLSFKRNFTNFRPGNNSTFKFTLTNFSKNGSRF
jgi:hypothetical protein